jgi:hypothetical protein
LVAVCGGTGRSDTTSAGPPQRGGTLTVLERNSFGADRPAYQAIQAGQGQVYEGMSTTPLVA